MILKMLVGGLLAALLSAAPAFTSNADVKLNGWEVGKKDGTCIAVYAYKDKDDDNAANAISLGLVKAPDGKDVMIISIYYDKWDNDGDDTADLYFDKQLVLQKAKWKKYDKHTLVGTFAGAKSIMERLSDADQIILKFDPKTTAEFDIANPSQALGALQQCNAS
jgi:hypothetical protein